MMYIVTYKDVVHDKGLSLSGRSLFTVSKIEKLNQMLNDLDCLINQKVISYFPFYYSDNDCIYYKNAKELKEKLSLEPVSEEVGEKLFEIDTVGDFPYEQLKETVTEGFEKINVLTGSIIINESTAEILIKSYLVLKLQQNAGEQIWFGSEIPTEKKEAFEYLKHLYSSEAKDLDSLVKELVVKAHTQENIIC